MIDPINLSFREAGGEVTQEYSLYLNRLAKIIHIANEKWWKNIQTGEAIERNDGEMIALMHSELSEALEGVRKNLQDDKLPYRKMVEVEMADCIIRILDYCAGRGLDVGGALVEKCAFNRVRKDHSVEERLKDNGKKF